MDVSLPSYEAAMRDAREYLRRRDLSSQDEVPLYFAWERLYAAANANLSTDFFHETSAERRARQQARLSPRRGLPPQLFTSFDKVNRRSAQASAFLRSDSSSDVAIEMMARRYRREAEKLRSSREKLGVGALESAGKRLKKEKRRHKSPELEVEELLEAFEHSQVLPEDKVRASAMARGKFGLARSKTDELGADLTATKAAELRKSSFSKHNPATTPSLSNVAGVAAFAARVTDWRMPSDIDATSPSSRLLKTKGMSTSAKRLGGASELRGSAPVEDGEGDMTFDTSLGSSGFEEDSVESELSLETGTSSAAQMSRRRTQQDEAVGGKATANQEQKGSKRGASGKKLADPSTATANTDTNSTTAQQHLAEDYDALANASNFQQKLVQLSHAVGDMQVKIQGKQIEVTFKGALGDTGNADVKEREALASAMNSAESTQPSVAQKVFDTTRSGTVEGGGRNDEGGGRDDEGDAVEEQAGSAEQLMEAGIPAKASQMLPRKQSSVRFADMESRDHSDGGDRQSERKQTSEQHEQGSTFASSVLGAQRDNPPRIPSSTHSSGRQSTVTRSTIETELVRDEEFREEANTNEELKDQRSSSKLVRRQANSDQERNGQDADLGADDFRANTSNRSPADEASRNGGQERLGSTSQRQHPDEYQREQSAHTPRSGLAPAATEERDTRSDVPRDRADSSSAGSQDIAGLDGQTRTRTDTQHAVQGDMFIEEHSLQQSRRDTTTATEKSDTRSQSSRSRADSSSSRPQDLHSLDGETHTDTDTQHDIQGGVFIEELSLQEHDQYRAQSCENTTSATEKRDTRSQSSRSRAASSSSRPQDTPGLDEQTRTQTDIQHDDHRAQPHTDTTTAMGRSDLRSQSSRDHADSSEGTRSQDMLDLGEQTRLGTDKQDGVQGEIFTAEHLVQEHDQSHTTHRQSRTDTTTATLRSDIRSQPSRGRADSSGSTRSQDILGVDEQTRTNTEPQHAVHSLQEHDQHRAQSRVDATSATGRRNTRPQSSRSRVDSSSSRPQDIPGLDEQTRTRADDVQGDVFVEERPLHRASHRQPRRDTTATHVDHELRPRTTRRESSAPRSRRDFEHSIEPSDDENGVDLTNDGESDSSEEVRIPRKRSSGRPSDRHAEVHRTARPSRSTSSKARERSAHRMPETHNRSRASVHEPRRSRNQWEELVGDELYSDEELSDGPDTPYRQPQQQRGRHDSHRQQSWVSDDSRESLTHKSSKRLPSRPVPHVKSHSKRRSYSPESRADSDAMSSSDYDSLEEQSTEHRSQPARNRHDQPQSSRKPTHKPSSRDHHFIPAMKYPPKLSKPDVRLKRDSKSKSESRSKEGAGRPRKLPEGIVWPPGMEEECIARLGLDGHHPIAPPGLEHLVTEEQWGEYWTWLHWYSSWQMWYMKKGKKPTRKSDKDKRSDRRRADAYESPDDEEYHEKRANANWRLDVGPGKHHRRRSRNRVD